MKSSTTVCALLAASFGFTSIAWADPGRGGRDHDRGDRYEQHQERREARAEHREDRRDRVEQRVDRAYRQGYRTGNDQQPRHVYSQPRHGYQQPSYVYQPNYRSGSRFSRGGYLPAEYRHTGYYVNNWNAHAGLYAPPYGHQWVQVGSDFLLVAIATGLIANLLTQ